MSEAATDLFERRHLGPRPADVDHMLDVVGAPSLGAAVAGQRSNAARRLWFGAASSRSLRRAVAVPAMVVAAALGWAGVARDGSTVVRDAHTHPSTVSRNLLSSALEAYETTQARLGALPVGQRAWAEIGRVLETAEELFRVGRPRESESLLRHLSLLPELAEGAKPSDVADGRVSRSTYHRLWAEILRYEGRTDEGLAHSADAVQWVSPPRGTQERKSLILAAAVHGESLAELGDDSGVSLIEEHLEQAQVSVGSESELVARSLCALGAGLFYQRRLLDAEAFIEQCGARTARTLGVDSLEYASYEAFSGAVHWGRDDRDAAMSKTRSALARTAGLLGSTESRLVIELMSNVGTLLWMRGELLPAETRLREALELAERVLGPSSRQTSVILQSLAVTLRRAGRLAEAEGVQRRNVKIRSQPGRNAVDLATAHETLAAILRQRGRVKESLGYSESALRIRQERFGGRSLLTASSQMELARCLLAAGRPERAAQLLAEVVETRRRMLRKDSPLLQESRDLLVESLIRRDRAET